MLLLEIKQTPIAHVPSTKFLPKQLMTTFYLLLCVCVRVCVALPTFYFLIPNNVEQVDRRFQRDSNNFVIVPFQTVTQHRMQIFDLSYYREGVFRLRLLHVNIKCHVQIYDDVIDSVPLFFPKRIAQLLDYSVSQIAWEFMLQLVSRLALFLN